MTDLDRVTPILGGALLLVVSRRLIAREAYGSAWAFLLLSLIPTWILFDPTSFDATLQRTLDAIASVWQEIVASLVGLGAVLVAYRPGSVPPRLTLAELEAKTRAMEREEGV